MSAYCTIVDLKNYLPANYIQQLTDDNSEDDIDNEKVTDVIRRSSNLIDGYLRGRYPVPVVDPTTQLTPDMVRDLATRIAIYYLFLRGLTQTVPEALKLDYDMCIKTLVGMQQGKINAFAQTSEPVFFETNKHRYQRAFTDKPVIPNTTPSMLLPSTTGQNDWNTFLL